MNKEREDRIALVGSMSSKFQTDVFLQTFNFGLLCYRNASQHFLRYPVLHDTQAITRDFAAVTKWMKKVKTVPELRIIICCYEALDANWGAN